MTHKLIQWLTIGLIVSISSVAIASSEKSLEVKTVPGIHFFYAEYSLSNENMHKQGDKIAEKTAYAIATKTPTVLNGPFTYIFENVQSFLGNLPHKLLRRNQLWLNLQLTIEIFLKFEQF